MEEESNVHQMAMTDRQTVMKYGKIKINTGNPIKPCLRLHLLLNLYMVNYVIFTLIVTLTPQSGLPWKQ